MKVLIVEDSPQDLLLAQEMLTKIIHISSKLICEVVKSMTEFTQQINTEYDIILLDLNLLDSNGLNTVIEADKIKQKSINSHTPIIVLTGVDDYSIAKQSLEVGARDYLIKGEYDANKLERSIRFATYSNHNPKRKGWIKKMLAS